MAYCEVTPCALAPHSELQMTLYTNKEVYGSGPDRNAWPVADGASSMGKTQVYSWPVADGATPDANIVGRLQGTSVVVANSPWVYHYNLGLVFEDERFKGSTLQIQGTSQISGEWSIVGGTGELAKAMGTVKRTEIVFKDHTRISELKIRVNLFRSSEA